MNTPELERAAKAIAEVRERYGVSQIYDAARPYVFGHDMERSQAECQAWIDEQAARACLLAVIDPVSDAVTKSMSEANASAGYCDAHEAYALEFKAAITHISKEGT